MKTTITDLPAELCCESGVYIVIVKQGNRVKELYKTAVAAALNGDWEQAHVIVQEYGDTTACWIHAVLHKIEGDAGNSRYWYARAHRSYDDYADARLELQAIAEFLKAGSAE